MSLKFNKYFICKAPTLCWVKLSTLVSPCLANTQLCEYRSGNRQTDKDRHVVGRALDHCAQENQRGL